MMEIDAKAISLEHQAGRVRGAFYAMLEAQDAAEDTAEMDAAGGGMENGSESAVAEMPEAYLTEVYDTYAIACKPDGTYWKVNYTLSADTVTFALVGEWQLVEKEWIAAKAIPDMLVYDGGAIKALAGDRIGGYLVLWGNPDLKDLTGEYFTPQTDLGLDWYDRRPLLFHHGLDPAVKGVPIGVIDTVKADDIGLWAEGILDTRNRYVRAIKTLVDKGALGWSSGTLSALREVKASGEMVRWPIAEGSLTHVPVDPRTSAVPIQSLPIKALDFPREPEAASEGGQPPMHAATAHEVTVRLVVEPPLKAAGFEPAPVAHAPTPSRIEVKTMSDELNPTATPPAPQNDGRLDALEGSVKSISDQVAQVLDMMQNSPAVRKAGYYSETGGKSDPDIKSLGDFMLTVARRDTARLTAIYKTTKAMNSDSGTTGGYLLPTDFNTTLLEQAAVQSPVVANVTRVPTTTASGKVPVIDITRSVTAGSGATALAGGLTTSARAESAAYTTKALYFQQVEFNVHNVSGQVPVSIELVQDSPVSIEALLSRYIVMAVSAKKEQLILRGTGVGEPLGILNAPALISVTVATNNTFAYADALSMVSRFRPGPMARPAWIIHRSIIPDLGVFEVGTGGAVWVANLQTGINMPLLGYPIYISEHLPQANNSGAVVLADLASYLLFERGAISIDYSEHADRANGNVVWFFDQRIDGQPELKSSITEADPQGSFTVSPFVKADD